MKKKYFIIKELFGNMFIIDIYDNLEDAKNKALAINEEKLSRDRKSEIRFFIMEGWE